MAQERTVQEMFDELLTGFYSFKKEVKNGFKEVNEKIEQSNDRIEDEINRVNNKMDTEVYKVTKKIDKLNKKTGRSNKKLNDIEQHFRTFKKLTLKHGLDIEYLKDGLKEESKPL